jgi:hypothetical protein
MVTDPVTCASQTSNPDALKEICIYSVAVRIEVNVAETI